jgi:hypothetical protein
MTYAFVEPLVHSRASSLHRSVGDPRSGATHQRHSNGFRPKAADVGPTRPHTPRGRRALGIYLALVFSPCTIAFNERLDTPFLGATCRADANIGPLVDRRRVVPRAWPPSAAQGRPHVHRRRCLATSASTCCSPGQGVTSAPATNPPLAKPIGNQGDHVSLSNPLTTDARCLARRRLESTRRANRASLWDSIDEPTFEGVPEFEDGRYLPRRFSRRRRFGPPSRQGFICETAPKSASNDMRAASRPPRTAACSTRCCGRRGRPGNCAKQKKKNNHDLPENGRTVEVRRASTAYEVRASAVMTLPSTSLPPDEILEPFDHGQ